MTGTCGNRIATPPDGSRIVPEGGGSGLLGSNEAIFTTWDVLPLTTAAGELSAEEAGITDPATFRLPFRYTDD